MTINVGQQASFFTVPNFYEHDQVCNKQYTVKITSDPEKPFILYNASSRNITWLSPTHQGVYQISFYSKFIGNDFTYKEFFVFSLNVTTKRSLQSVTIAQTYIPNQDYVIGTCVNEQYQFTEFAVTDGGCGQDNVYYKLQISSDQTQPTSFISLVTNENSIFYIYWYTELLTQVGVYTITLTGYLPTIPYTPASGWIGNYYNTQNNPTCDVSGGTTIASSTFTLTTTSPQDCNTYTSSIQFNSFLYQQTVVIQSAPSSIQLSQIQVACSTYCIASNIDYSATITADSGQSTSFISFNPTTLTITWSTPTIKGVYSVRMQGVLTTNAGLYAVYNIFKLSVIINCQTTTDIITLQSTLLQPITVKINTAASSVTFAPFVVTGSTYCSASDITYTVAIVPDNSQSTQFMQFSTKTLQLSWVSPTTAGTYTTTVTGTILKNNQNNKVVETAQFILFVISCITSTDQIVITPPQSAIEIKVLYKSQQNTLTIPNFTQVSQQCTDQDILYSNITSQNTDLITFYPNQLMIEWDISLMGGHYTVQVIGSITNAVATYSANLNVAIFVYCETTDWSLNLVDQFQDYTLGDLIFIVIQDFIVTNCNVVSTFLSSTKQNIIPIIKFNQTNDVTGAANLEIQSFDVLLIGTYNITVHCTDLTTLDTRKFQILLNVYDICSNTTVSVPQTLNDQTYTITDNSNISPIYWQDFTTNNVQCSLIKYKVKISLVQGQNIVDWFTVDTDNQIITVKKQTTQTSLSSIVSINITGYINGLSQLPSASTTFSIYVESNTTSNKTTKSQTVKQGVQVANVSQVFTYIPKVPNNMNQTKLIIVPLKAVIDSISRSGLCKIIFNQPIMIPELYQNLTTQRQQPNFTETIQQVIRLTMISGVDIVSLDRLNILSYNLTEFTSAYLCIQINFANPELISQSVLFKDQLIVTFMIREMFLEKQTFKILPEQNSVINIKVGPQISQSELTKLEKIETNIDNATQLVAITNLIINLFLAFGLKFLWNMVNLLQFLVYMQTWQIQMPNHTNAVLKFIKNIALLEFLPTQQITGKISEWFDLDPNDENGIFNNMGIMLIIAIGLLIIVILLSIAQYFVLSDYKWYRRYRLINQFIFYNSFLRYLLQSCLKLGMGAGTAVTIFAFSDRTKQDVLKALPQITVLILISSLPFIFWFIINKYRSDLHKPTIKAKIGSLYLGIKTNTQSNIELLCSSIFVVRRLLFIMVTYLIPSKPCIQIQSWINISICYVIYFMNVQPYDSKFATQIEFINEILFLIVCYHFLLLTDVVQEQGPRDGLGWSLIATIGAILILNLGVILGVNISNLVRKCKLRMLKQNAIKQHQILQQQKAANLILNKNKKPIRIEQKQGLDKQLKRKQNQQYKINHRKHNAQINKPVIESQLVFSTQNEKQKVQQQHVAIKTKHLRYKLKPLQISRQNEFKQYPKHMIVQYDHQRDQILKEFDMEVEKDFQEYKRSRNRNQYSGF